MTIGTAVVGVGFIGEKHTRIYSQLPNSRLVAIVDSDQAKAKALAEELGCEWYANYEDIVDNPDIQAVTLCLPEDLHVEPTIAFAKAGKHILLEKPMAMTVEECDMIIHGIRDTNVKLMIAHLLHFDPKYSMAKEYIASGKIGDIVHIVAQRNGLRSAGLNIGAARDISVLHHVGIHDYELALWYADAEVERVYGEWSDKVLGPHGKTQDSFWGLVKFRNGSFASIGSSWIFDDSIGSTVNARMEIIGTKGALFLNSGHDGSLRIFTSDGWVFPDVYHWPLIGEDIAGCLREEVIHFLRCVDEDTEPSLSIANARKAVEVINSLLKAAEKGQPVYL